MTPTESAVKTLDNAYHALLQPTLQSATHNEHGQPVGPALPQWQPARAPSRVTLTGRYVRLEPVDASRHAADLHAAYQTPTDEPIWTYLSIGPFANAIDFSAYLETISTSVDPLHFALVDVQTNRALGTFSLMRIDPANGVIEVGFVVYSPLLRRTRLASEAIFLLMRHVFDDLGYRRFEWKCDALNAPSRAAALRYGFQFEGLFRQAIVYRGRSRDTAWFSILDVEWPALRQCFETWLSPENFDTGGHQIRRLSALVSTIRT